MTPTYAPHPKHKFGYSVAGPPRHLPGSSKCPAGMTLRQAQELVDQAFILQLFSESEGPFPGRIWAYLDGTFYCGMNTNLKVPTYHGYPVGPAEVPTAVKRRLLDAGILNKAEYRRFLGGRR